MADLMLINGEFRGKVGQLCGEKWKNKRVIKAKGVPKDPKSQKQIVQRERFAILDKIICPIVADAKKLCNYDLTKMSAHNFFLKLNNKFCETGKTEDIIVTKGTLQPIANNMIMSKTITLGDYIIEWRNPDMFENWRNEGRKIYAVIANPENIFNYSQIQEAIPTPEGIRIPFYMHGEGTYRCWIWIYWKKGNSVRVSNSYTETFFMRT